MAFLNILDYYANLNTPYLHGGGRHATEQLVQVSRLDRASTVFELGCGTGSSLVHLAHNMPWLSLTGGDISANMLRKARQRIWVSGLQKRISLVKLQEDAPLPFADNSFDAVWIESVLAIQETNTISRLLREIHRILKPNGELLQNETLWLEETSVGDRHRVNEKCIEHFGIIQANAEIATLSNWKKQLLSAGFQTTLSSSVSALPENQSLHKFTNSSRSKMFSTLGKALQLVHPQRKQERKTVTKLETQILGSQAPLMDAFLFVSSCNKVADRMIES